LALSAILGLTISTTALADYDCAALTHCYSVAGLNDGKTTTGIFGTWQSSALNPDSTFVGSHTNTTVWLLTSTLPSWVEVGLINYSPGSPYGSGYEVYWAEGDSSGNFYFHAGASTTADGSEHNYEIQQNSHTNWFNVYRDYKFVGTSTKQSYWTSCSAVGCNEAGGELGVSFDCPGPRPGTCGSDLDPSESAGGFDVYLQSKSTGGAWYYWPSAAYSTDLGCGPNPSGYCLNGYPYYTYEWSWNKP